MGNGPGRSRLDVRKQGTVWCLRNQYHCRYVMFIQYALLTPRSSISSRRLHCCYFILHVIEKRFVMHLRWPPHIGPKNDTYNLGENPQLSLSVKNGATRGGGGGSGSTAAVAAAAGGAAAAAAGKKSPTVWVLLSRYCCFGQYVWKMNKEIRTSFCNPFGRFEPVRRNFNATAGAPLSQSFSSELVWP